MYIFQNKSLKLNNYVYDLFHISAISGESIVIVTVTYDYSFLKQNLIESIITWDPVLRKMIFIFADRNLNAQMVSYICVQKPLR